jgi:Domain of unknown function (DUF6766)
LHEWRDRDSSRLGFLFFNALPAQISDYVFRMSRDTLENWQSEFLQLIWQVAGLALLLYVGSPKSK